jgi:hypothetical protein
MGPVQISEIRFSDIARSLENIADTTRGNGADLPDPLMERSLLLAFYGGQQVPGLELWRLRITPLSVAAERIQGITIRGAVGNRARFFDHYFKEGLPLDSLTFLAANIVLAAGRIDPVMIQGLDVAVINPAGFRLLSETEKMGLRKRSDQLDALIRKRLLA